MKRDLIFRIVPDADPEFVRIMGDLPDPPTDAAKRMAAALPRMHKIFLQKKEAVKRGDKAAFSRLTEEEVALIKQMDQAV